MKILFVARHGQHNSSDDEGAIASALVSLGHEVTCLNESSGQYAPQYDADLLLFLKWLAPAVLAKMRCRKVFHYFDLVTCPDPTLRSRCRARQQWMREVLPHVDLGFLTDGDHVARDRSRKLVWLPQGADGRIVGRGCVRRPSEPILFTGIRNGGQGRASFVDELQARYGKDFRQVSSGVYRRELADLIASSEIVVAPDAPVTDRYASNRVFTSLGFGAFLLHPRCAFLEPMYEDRKEVVYYGSREELHDLIAYFRARPDERRAIAEAGLARTIAEHTYAHRVAKLIATARERLGLP